MDTIETYRQTIERILTEYAQIPYAYGDIQSQTVFDRANDHYLLMNVGWDERRVHGCLVHIDIIGDKLWIQTPPVFLLSEVRICPPRTSTMTPSGML